MLWGGEEWEKGKIGGERVKKWKWKGEYWTRWMMNQVNGVNEVNGEFGESVDFVSVDVKCKKGQKVKSDFS